MRAKFQSRDTIRAFFLTNFIVATTCYGTPVKKPLVHNAASSYDATVCSKMNIDYELASKKLAYNHALIGSEKSQVRASQLASEDNVTIIQANMTLGLMRDNHCPMPTFAPSATRYMMQSLNCSTALSKQSADMSFYRLQQTLREKAAVPSTDMPQQCDFNKWTVEEYKPSTNSVLATIAETAQAKAAVPIEGTCASCSAAEDRQRLQRASDSSATTFEQREKMKQIVSARTTNGVVNWHAAAEEYFAWYRSQPYHP